MSWQNRKNCRWHYIAELVKKHGFKRGVELGVKEGRFSSYLLGQFPELTMIGVDMYRERQHRDRLGYETYSAWDFQKIIDELHTNTDQYGERFELLRMDTITAAETVDDGSQDFVFVDAEHTYEAVMADIEAWRPKIRAGGILCGHDYAPHIDRFAGVIRAVDEMVDEVQVGWDAVWWSQL